MIKTLNIKDEKNYLELIDDVVNNMENKSWFIQPTAEEQKNWFLEKDKFLTLGFFDNKKLVGASSFVFGVEGMEDVLKFINITSQKVCEIGPCIVCKEFRGKNIMLKLNQKLLKLAKERGIEYVVATAHPDNVASNKSLQKLGLSLFGQFKRNKTFLRNVYVLKI